MEEKKRTFTDVVNDIGKKVEEAISSPLGLLVMGIVIGSRLSNARMTRAVHKGMDIYFRNINWIKFGG